MISVKSLLNVLYYAVALLGCVSIHEYAHAFVAHRLGDHTPKLYGRLTLNPRRHVDPFGTLLLPGILLIPILFSAKAFLPFAYGKPQTVNAYGFRNPERDPVLIAVAGPVVNLLLALALGGVFRLVAPGPGEALSQVAVFVRDVLEVSVVLGVMNIIPIPPLDGARIIARFLPPRAREVFTNLEQYGALFMLAIFFIFAGPIFNFVVIVGNGICRTVAGQACI